MKKRNQLFTLMSLSMLFSCTDVKRATPSEVAKSDTEVITPVPTTKELGHDSSKTKEYDVASSGINYVFSNDTLCQTLSIKEKSKNIKLKIPENLEFKLVLHDQQHKYDDKIFEGVAKLFSPEESFSDNSDKEGGDYDAADYDFEAANYKIQIRLDVQSYEACVVSVRSSRPDIVLGGYDAYLKKFPNDGVMKKGECKNNP